MKNAVGYVRCSTEEQSLQGVSLAMQERRIRLYAESEELVLVNVLHDDGVSGGKRLEDRPAGHVLMQMIQKRNVDTVIVFKLDRLGRTTLDVLSVIEHMSSRGIALHSLTERLDTMSSIGRFVIRTLASLAEMERDQVRERTVAALQYKRRMGKLIGNVPYGYDLQPDGETLGRNETEQTALKFMMQLQAEGLSYRAIAQKLQLAGYSTKNGQKNWQHCTVRSVIAHAQKYESTS